MSTETNQLATNSHGLTIASFAPRAYFRLVPRSFSQMSTETNQVDSNFARLPFHVANPGYLTRRAGLEGRGGL